MTSSHANGIISVRRHRRGRSRRVLVHGFPAERLLPRVPSVGSGSGAVVRWTAAPGQKQTPRQAAAKTRGTAVRNPQALRIGSLARAFSELC